MKKDKNISLSLSSSDERLGSVFSRGLAQLKTGETGHCLDPESIAAVVEGTVTDEERDRILRHVSACDTCYEMFLLTSELQKEEEIKQETHKILWLKPLAMAASILIVIFSVYIFFRSEEIPKTSTELLEKSDALKESRGKLLHPATEAPKSKMAIVKDKEEEKIADHKPAAPPLEYRRKKIEAKAPAKPMPEPKKETTRDEDKSIEKKEADISEGIGIEREKQEEVKAPMLAKKGVDEDRFKMRASKSKAIGRKRAGESYKKMEMATQMAETGETQQSPSLVVGQAVPVQNQAVQLNVVGQRFDNYIPQKELENLFKETIALSQQLGKEFETVRKQAVKTNNLNEIDSYIKGLKPMIRVKMVGGAAYITPNVEWFFSRSAPQSIEYQFFSLARSGWCDTSGLCYEGVKGVHRQLMLNRKTQIQIREKGKLSESEDATRSLLVEWQALHPQLRGIFKEIANNTITHLKTSQ